MNTNWQMQRFLVRHRMKQKIVELARKYPVSGLKPASRVLGQQQLFEYGSISETATQRFQ